MDIRRLPNPSEKDYLRLDRYKQGYVYLRQRKESRDLIFVHKKGVYRMSRKLSK